MAFIGQYRQLFSNAALELGLVPIEYTAPPPGGFLSAWAININRTVQYMKKNVAGQKIGAQMVSATDGSSFSGSVTVYVTGDAGTQSAGSVGAGACTHEGNGYYTYAPAQAETNYDLIAFTFTGTGAVPGTVQVFTTFPQTGDAFDRLGAPAGASVSADIAAVKTQTAAIETDTQDIQSRLPAALVSGRIDASVGAMATDVLTSTALASSAVTEIQTGLATSSALSTLQTTANNIETDTQDIQTRLPAALVSGRMDSSTGAMATDVITSTALAASAVTEIQSGLSTLTSANVSSAVWDAATASYGSAGTYGALVETNLDATVSSRSTLTQTQVTGGAYSVQSSSCVLGDSRIANLDGTITSRMATYTQPTGFLAATFPSGTIANTTNITAGTITTATNVTTVNGLAANVITAAATASDFTTEIQTGLATAAALAVVDGIADDIKAVTTKLDTALVLDGAVYQYTANALELAPGGNPWVTVIENGLTAEEILRIMAATLAGKASGAGTGTETFVGLDGTTDRVISTVDASGNRSSVVVDGT